ncbi:hypothetical protein PQ077_01235 [Litorivicinus sp.]|nr:hypothetical protein [Litorivicinus sp.]
MRYYSPVSLVTRGEASLGKDSTLDPKSTLFDDERNLNPDTSLAELNTLIKENFPNLDVHWVRDGLKLRPELTLRQLKNSEDIHKNRSNEKSIHQIEILEQYISNADSFEASDRAYALAVSLLKKQHDRNDWLRLKESICNEKTWFDSLNENQKVLLRSLIKKREPDARI